MGVAGMSFGKSSYETFAAFYILLRCLLLSKYLRAWATIEGTRTLIKLFMAGFGIAVLCWTGSVLAFGTDIGSLLAGVGLLIDYGTPLVLLPFMVGIHAKHMTERFSAWTALISSTIIFAFVAGASPIDMTLKTSMCTTFFNLPLQ